jgi:hypothetical protein
MFALYTIQSLDVSGIVAIVGLGNKLVDKTPPVIPEDNAVLETPFITEPTDSILASD